MLMSKGGKIMTENKEKRQETALLEVRDFSLSFIQYEKGLRQRTINVINDINLTVHPGEILAIIGSSGSGKSLLAHGILGILPKNAHKQGKIFYQGQEVAQDKFEKLRGKEISLIPQSVNYLDPLMKVDKQVQLGVKEDRSPIDIQKSIFKKYHLDENAGNCYPFQLSGGMTRRVLVSTGVVGNANLIIADEPTPGLHPEIVAETLDSFKNLANEGKGVIFITHDISTGLKIADRIAVFYSGLTLEVASAKDFSGKGENLRHPYTKALWNALPQNDFKPISGFQPLASKKLTGCVYFSRCPMATDACTNEQPSERVVREGIVRCIHAT